MITRGKLGNKWNDIIIQRSKTTLRLLSNLIQSYGEPKQQQGIFAIHGSCELQKDKTIKEKFAKVGIFILPSLNATKFLSTFKIPNPSFVRSVHLGHLIPEFLRILPHIPSNSRCFNDHGVDPWWVFLVDHKHTRVCEKGFSFPRVASLVIDPELHIACNAVELCTLLLLFSVSPCVNSA